MAIDNKDKKVLKSSIEREQNEVACSAECEKIKGSKNLNVPHLRFPEFSEEWDSFKLVELGKFIGGGTPSSSNLSFWTGSIPWISSSDIKEDNINNISISRYITEDAIEKSATKYCPAPVILIVSRVGVGKVALSHTSLCTSQDFCNIIDIKCHPVFLSYNLLRTMKRKSREVQGTSIKGITSDELQKIRVFIPKNKDEQNKISNLLTLLDERIATQNKIIDKLQSLIKGISSRIFTSIQGIEYRMGDIVTITNGNNNVQDAVTQSKDGLYPFFDRSEDIKYLPTFLFDKEAIIYPGEGTEFMPRYFKGKFALHQRCYAIFDFNEIINARFLYFYLKTRNSYFVKNAVGSTVPSLRLDTFQKLKVIIPSKKIQHSVSLCLSSMEQKCNVEKKILHKLLKQKQYLLRQMFI